MRYDPRLSLRAGPLGAFTEKENKIIYFTVEDRNGHDPGVPEYITSKYLIVKNLLILTRES